jgi:hypothetical protein
VVTGVAGSRCVVTFVTVALLSSPAAAQRGSRGGFVVHPPAAIPNTARLDFDRWYQTSTFLYSAIS